MLKAAGKFCEEESVLQLTQSARAALWRRTHEAIEAYLANVKGYSIAPEMSPNAVRALIEGVDFKTPLTPPAALELVVGGLLKYQTHVSHPGYFGLFNPLPSAMGVIADTLVAAFNPQAGSWSASSFAVEVEQHLIRFFGGQFGYDPKSTYGCFTSGGSEANHTALLTALANRFPQFREDGLRGLPSEPVIYVSKESHHTNHRSVQLCGLGQKAIREIEVGDNLQLDTQELDRQIQKDRHDGFTPLMIVATAGTTSAGVVDSIGEIAAIAKREGLWMHLDAAWGGAAVLVPELRHLFKCAGQTDSITFDAHKWLSVPMGAGIFLTRHRGILEKTFRIDTPYVPEDTSHLDIIEPYQQSIQWSRRFIGLKVFLSLAVAGIEGYASVLKHHVEMGNLLRRKLDEAGWIVVNETPLPVVCFRNSGENGLNSSAVLNRIARDVIVSGRSWISTTRVGTGQSVLRACITNYKTSTYDIEILIEDLNEARKKILEELE